MDSESHLSRTRRSLSTNLLLSHMSANNRQSSDLDRLFSKYRPSSNNLSEKSDDLERSNVYGRESCKMIGLDHSRFIHDVAGSSIAGSDQDEAFGTHS